ncbi:DUF962-domain-containing protein [Syncephalis plumigaleata]|nr:DUF962-domain-containing protein [Syncephalis plumigaleata]
MGILDLEQQLIFYGSYHSNKVNVFCHIACVPLILWSALVLASAIPPVTTIVISGITVQIGVPLCAVLFYSFYYLLLEPGAGMLLTPILYVMSTTAGYFYSHVDNAMQTAVIVQVFSWAAQIFTHHVFEKRAPALQDNLAQAFLQAPLFVFLEILFAFGYRPALHKRIRNQVGINVTRFRREAAAKRRQAASVEKIE